MPPVHLLDRLMSYYRKDASEWNSDWIESRLVPLGN